MKFGRLGSTTGSGGTQKFAIFKVRILQSNTFYFEEVLNQSDGAIVGGNNISINEQGLYEFQIVGSVYSAGADFHEFITQLNFQNLNNLFEWFVNYKIVYKGNEVYNNIPGLNFIHTPYTTFFSKTNNNNSFITIQVLGNQQLLIDDEMIPYIFIKITKLQ